MAKQSEREKVLQMRKKGASYSQIKTKLGVSKSTLAYWLKDLPLSPQRMRELRDWNQHRIERYRETRRQQRGAHLKRIYAAERKNILPLSKRDIFIGGLFLYWGEGGKTSPAELTFSNADSAMLKWFILWARKTFGIAPNRFRVRVHLYADMNIAQELKFWSRILNIPLSQFRRPYIKKSKRSELTYKNLFGHGTCNLHIRNAELTKKVLMSLKVLQDYANLKAK
jgi:hypothetical protein